MLENTVALEARRLDILEGISQNLTHSEISAQLGVNQWDIKRDIKLMQRNGDLGLIHAEKAQIAVREKKALLLVKEMRHFKQNERFLGITGITLQEKSFRNMIDFNKQALLKIMKSEDQHAAIFKLPKSIRNTLQNNGIITNRCKDKEISIKTLDYLFN